MDQGRSFDERLRLALALMDEKGIGKTTSGPPFHRLLWKAGIRLPPPLMTGFVANALLMGAMFGVLWSATMWLLSWARQGVPASDALLMALFSSVLFGLAMAAVNRHLSRKHGIPAWRDFTV